MKTNIILSIIIAAAAMLTSCDKEENFVMERPTVANFEKASYAMAEIATPITDITLDGEVVKLTILSANASALTNSFVNIKSLSETALTGVDGSTTCYASWSMQANPTHPSCSLSVYVVPKEGTHTLKIQTLGVTPEGYCNAQNFATNEFTITITKGTDGGWSLK